MIFSRILKLLSALPLSVLYKMADIVSLFVLVIPNRTARLIDRNIRLCFPGQDDKVHRQLYRNTVKQTVYSALELAAVWCWPAQKILARITELQICAEFLQSKKGRIVIAPHLGCWELLSLWLAQECQVISLFKPRPEDSVNQFILNARSRNGAVLLPVNSSGLRQLSKGLKQKKTAMILPDQKPRKYKARVMANFFGQPAPTTPLVHNLCSRFDCDVFIAAVYRNPDKSEFSIRIDLLDAQKIASDQDDGINYMNGEIERLIQLKPEQYQWGYSRFEKQTFQTAPHKNH